ncbi:MAG: RNA pseudouridine synthase [Myxococcales bacterium]|nr:RNA pseudouridine synthase [Myxococcales bacterium]MCB9731372.1 RNA pseudouridine synthase [Deltaproteobacteria bacterium]
MIGAGEPPRIAILLERDGLVVVDKPAGLRSTGDDLDDPDCAQGQLMVLLRRRRVWAVHQLDSDTSGVNLFVTQKALVDVWSRHLKADEGGKTYVALVHGLVTAPVRVEVPLGRARRADGREIPAVVRAGAVGAKDAVTLVEPVDHVATRDGGVSVVLARPLTGRTHQVRLHLAWLGHPLLGERLHRDPPSSALGRHALHAWRVDAGGASFIAPMPADLRALAAALGLRLP